MHLVIVTAFTVFPRLSRGIIPLLLLCKTLVCLCCYFTMNHCICLIAGVEVCLIRHRCCCLVAMRWIVHWCLVISVLWCHTWCHMIWPWDWACWEQPQHCRPSWVSRWLLPSEVCQNCLSWRYLGAVFSCRFYLIPLMSVHVINYYTVWSEV